MVAIYKDIRIRFKLAAFKPTNEAKELTSKQLRFIINSDLYQNQINEIIKKLKPLNIQKEYSQYCFLTSDHLHETHSIEDYVKLNLKLGLYFKRANRFYSMFEIEDLILEYINLNKIDFSDSLIADD